MGCGHHLRQDQSWLAILSFLVDVYSEKIVGGEVSEHLRSELATNALEMAMNARGGVTGDLIHHSDRGVQYLSVAYWKAP